MYPIPAASIDLPILPLYSYVVSAGFPSPADEHMDIRLDLNEYLISSPSSTFFVRAIGDSMTEAGINKGSLLIVDKAIQPKHNKIVIAVINGEFTVRRLKITKGEYILVAENPAYPPVKLNADSYIWGVVTSVINKL